jgi:ABC-type branched-subunit amino acid transport system permease subunit
MGPVYGVIILLALPIGLKEIPGYDPKIEPIILGSILVLIMLTMSEGFVSAPGKVWLLIQKARTWLRREEVDEYGTS